MPFNQNLSVPIVAGSSTTLSNTLAPASFANVAVNGPLGTASTTTDINTVFEITQTTANVDIILQSPTLNPAAGKLFTIKSSSASTNMFFMYGARVYPGQTTLVLWNGTVFSSVGEPFDSKSIQTVTTATATATRWNHIILCDTTANAVNITLPTNIGNIGKDITIVKSAGSNPVTVTATGLIGSNNTIAFIGGAITFIAASNTQTLTQWGVSSVTGAIIDDQNASTTTTYSSSKINSLAFNTFEHLLINGRTDGVAINITGGTYLVYTYNGNTIYRFLSTALDSNGYSVTEAFYDTLTSGVLSDLIVARG